MNQNDKWAKLKAMGKKKFILVYGVFGWGFLTALIFLVLGVVSKKGFRISDLGSLSFLKQLLVSMLVFPLIGYFWGLLIWKKLERQTKALLLKNRSRLYCFDLFRPQFGQDTLDQLRTATGIKT